MSSRWPPPHIARCIVKEHVILPPEPCGIREEERVVHGGREARCANFGCWCSTERSEMLNLHVDGSRL